MSDKYGGCSCEELSEGVREFAKLIGREFIDCPTGKREESTYRLPAMVTMTVDEYNDMQDTIQNYHQKLKEKE